MNYPRKFLKRHISILANDCTETIEKEGLSATLENADRNHLSYVKSCGNSVQAAFTGYNLLNADEIEKNGTSTLIRTENGIRVGSSSTGSFVYCSLYLSLTVGKKYTLSAKTTLSENYPEGVGGRMVIRMLDSSDKQLGCPSIENIGTGDQSITFTVKADTTRCQIMFYVNNGTAVSKTDYIDYDFILLVEGETTKPYEPYVGGKASPSVDYPQPVRCANDDGMTYNFVTETETFAVEFPASFWVNADTKKWIYDDTSAENPLAVYPRFAKIGEVCDEYVMEAKNKHATYTQRIGVIESYSGEEITGDYISTTGSLSVGAKVYYVLPEPIVYDVSELYASRLLWFVFLPQGDVEFRVTSKVPLSYHMLKYKRIA